MTSKHTPGPWHFIPQETYSIADDNGDTVATANWLYLRGRREHSEVTDNAHLIAAAPDMFEALQAFVDIPSPSDLVDENSAVGVVVTLAQFRAAVAALDKAKGQSDGKL